VTVLRACIAACVAGALLIALQLGSAASFGGLVLLGLACAPIYPALIAATPRRVGHAHTPATVGSQVGAAVLGAAIFPGLMGVLAARLGLEIIGPSLVALGAALLVAHEALVRSSPEPLV
jgi:fucose permease